MQPRKRYETSQRHQGWPDDTIASCCLCPLTQDTTPTAVAAPPPDLELDLPDPEQDGMSHDEFLGRIENAWNLCERFDLQTEIWRGRILRRVRDREKRGGDSRGMGFLQWLREREISKSKAYGLIQLADAADDLVADAGLQAASVNNFSKRAFVETAQAETAVQQMVSEAANDGLQINRQQVKRLHDEVLASTSPLLPDEIRRRTQANMLPSKAVAPLVKELAKLPVEQQEELQRELAGAPELDTVKEATLAARWLVKAAEAAAAVRALQHDNLNLDQAMKEAQRLELMGKVADAMRQAQQLEQAVTRLYGSWQRLGELHESLWLETGSSTPHLRAFLDRLSELAGSTVHVSLGELAGGKQLRLQLAAVAPDV